MAKDRTQLNLRLSEDLVVRLRLVAAVEGTTVSDFVRDAIVGKLRDLNNEPEFQARRDRWLRTLAEPWGDDGG